MAKLQVGSLPLTYLRLLLHHQKLPKQCWPPLIERMSSKLAAWKGKFLFWDGRLTLVNSVLHALPTYFMSIFKLSRWVLKRLDSMRQACLQKEVDKISGFHCRVNWDSTCKSKKQGGLGVKNLSLMNQSLLAKWA